MVRSENSILFTAWLWKAHHAKSMAENHNMNYINTAQGNTFFTYMFRPYPRHSPIPSILQFYLLVMQEVIST